MIRKNLEFTFEIALYVMISFCLFTNSFLLVRALMNLGVWGSLASSVVFLMGVVVGVLITYHRAFAKRRDDAREVVKRIERAQKRVAPLQKKMDEAARAQLQALVEDDIDEFNKQHGKLMQLKSYSDAILMEQLEFEDEPKKKVDRTPNQTECAEGGADA